MWTVAAKYPEMLKEAVRAFTPSVAAFYQIKAQFLSGIAVPLASQEIVRVGAEKIALQQMSYSGLGPMGGPQGGRGGGGIDSRCNPTAISNRIDVLSPLLRRVRITNVDFSTLLLVYRL
jgi:hypothetical protein